jgi:hypothetical protein
MSDDESLLEEAEFIKYRESFRHDLPADDVACRRIWDSFRAGEVRKGITVLQEANQPKSVELSEPSIKALREFMDWVLGGKECK